MLYESSTVSPIPMHSDPVTLPSAMTAGSASVYAKAAPVPSPERYSVSKFPVLSKLYSNKILELSLSSCPTGTISSDDTDTEVR